MQRRRRTSLLLTWRREVSVHIVIDGIEGRNVTKEEVDHLREEVHRFQCFSFFFWFVWAVMQTRLGSDWDCHGYALSRWSLYKQLKKQYYGIEALPVVSE